MLAARLLPAILLLAVGPACVVASSQSEGGASVGETCADPEKPLTILDGPYGSGVTLVDDRAAYPSFRSDYPKRLVIDRAANTARIEYVHEDVAIVEQWTMGAITTPFEGVCKREGLEIAPLTIASVTVDGAAGDLSLYDNWSVVVHGAADVIYRGAGGLVRGDFHHGFAPIFSKPCPFHRPAEGESCDETSICLYDLEGDACTARCLDGAWRSYRCAAN
jgi:hypothetical protein